MTKLKKKPANQRLLKNKALELRTKGLNIKDIANVINRDISAIYRWQKTDSTFAEQWEEINMAALTSKADKAIDALYDSFSGRTITMPNETITHYDENNNVMSKDVKEKSVYIQPDIKAAMFFLKTMNPKVWDALALERNEQNKEKLALDRQRLDAADDIETSLNALLDIRGDKDE